MGGETNEMILRLHQYLTDSGETHHVRFVPDPLFTMQMPTTARFWLKLCLWWQRGLVGSLKNHIDMLFRTRYGGAAFWGLPSCWLLEVAGLFITLAGYILVPVSCALGLVSPAFLIGFFALSVLFGIITSLGTLLLEVNMAREEPVPSRLALQCGMAILANFGYRQLISLVKIAGSFPYRRPGQT